ncbi:PQ loop repeat protein-like protein [Xylariaceae sp. FL0804]|nr:PQ loop repeat protein-like protein [Xylariaceae sp. FL0804]
MAPQTSIPLSASILGLIGTVFWCIQLLPQIWQNWRTKSTEGLPSTMMLLWGLCSLPFGVYAITQNFNIPLWVQPQFFCLFCISSWGQTMHYGKRWSTAKTFVVCLSILVSVAGLEVLLVLVLRGPYKHGEQWATCVLTFLGIVACIMLIAGYVPIPSELMKRRGRIVGISLAFLTIDWCGAFFSLMSLVAQNTFDITFGILYALVAAIEGSMFISHGIWLLRTRQLRESARNAGVTFDEFPEAIAWQQEGVDVTFETLYTKLTTGREGQPITTANIGLEDQPV